MQQENHKLLRAFAMATNAPLEPIVIRDKQPLHSTYRYIIQFLHAGRISLTPPRACH